jgi:hypothetical protein
MTDFNTTRDRDFSMTGSYGFTYVLTSTDSPQSFDSSYLTYSTAPSGEQARTAGSALVTCETYPVRVSWLTPPTFTLGHTLMVGDTLRIVGIINLENFQFVSASAGAAGVLQVTFEF